MTVIVVARLFNRRGTTNTATANHMSFDLFKENGRDSSGEKLEMTRRKSHNLPELLSKGLSFMKVYMEGFKIVMLQRVRHTFFHEPYVCIRLLLIEVGPKWWSHAGINFDSGVDTLVYFSRRFGGSFLWRD